VGVRGDCPSALGFFLHQKEKLPMIEFLRNHRFSETEKNVIVPIESQLRHVDAYGVDTTGHSDTCVCCGVRVSGVCWDGEWETRSGASSCYSGSTSSTSSSSNTNRHRIASQTPSNQSEDARRALPPSTRTSHIASSKFWAIHPSAIVGHRTC
jgi:hypothetical protein